MLAFQAVDHMPAQNPEGHRIHQFISAMRECGCSFDSQVIPTFGASGQFEYWDGEFTYRPARLRVATRLVIDHDMVVLRTVLRMARTEVRAHREALHQLLSSNRVGYLFEPDPESPEQLLVRLTTQVYDHAPEVQRLRGVLSQLANAHRELEHAQATGFRNYRPLIP